jgi:hypothetical protein
LPPNLRSLDLYIVGHSSVLDWLLSPVNVPNIRTVHFRWHGNFGPDFASTGAQTINKIFRALGPSLETVSLSFSDCYISMSFFTHFPLWHVIDNYTHTADESLRSLDWSHNTHLRSIGFEIGDHFRDCTAFVTQMLSQVNSVQIEQITFTLPSLLAVQGLLVAGPICWSRVEVELDKPRFSRLKHVDVSFLWVEEPYMLWRASVHLPRCHERGILRIFDGPPVL